jgi:hypothetical protein
MHGGAMLKAAFTVRDLENFDEQGLLPMLQLRKTYGQKLRSAPHLRSEELKRQAKSLAASPFEAGRADPSSAFKPDPARYERRRILSLNGCFAQHFGTYFDAIFDVKHVWRLTPPVIMSAPFGGRTFHRSPQIEQAERLHYELSKECRNHIKSFRPDVIFLDVTSDFGNPFLVNNGTIINDLKTAAYMLNLGSYEWPESFDVSQWRPLSAHDLHYPAVWMDSFLALMEMFKDQNVHFVILQRYVCELDIRANEIVAPAVVDANAINCLLEKMFALMKAQLGGLPNVTLVPSDRSEFMTSSDAPYGRWQFHPVPENYDRMFFRLARILGLSDEMVTAVMKRKYLERHKKHEGEVLRASELEARVAELERQIAEFGPERESWEAVRSERAQLAADLDSRNAELNSQAELCERLRQENEALSAEREKLAADSHDAETRAVQMAGRVSELLNQVNEERHTIAALKEECRRELEARDAPVPARKVLSWR